MIHLALSVAAFLFLAFVGLMVLLIGIGIIAKICRGASSVSVAILTKATDSFDRDTEALRIYFRRLPPAGKVLVQLFMWASVFGFFVLIVYVSAHYNSR
jgi:hypothetical protein